MLRVYVAGSYSADNVTQIQANMRRGLLLAVEAMKAGYAVFVPWLDFSLGIFTEISVAEYKRHSIAWLEVADAVLVQPEGWEQSKGTRAEIARAHELRIPVFFTLEELNQWAESR